METKKQISDWKKIRKDTKEHFMKDIVSAGFPEDAASEIWEDMGEEVKTKQTTKVRLTLHTYRRGGSMICDEQKMEFVAIPSLKEMRQLIEAYQEEIKYKGDVWFDISGRIEGGTE